MLCHQCQSNTHLPNDCPHRTGGGKGKGGAPSMLATSNYMALTDEDEGPLAGFLVPQITNTRSVFMLTQEDMPQVAEPQTNEVTQRGNTAPVGSPDWRRAWGRPNEFTHDVMPQDQEESPYISIPQDARHVWKPATSWICTRQCV